MLFACAAHGARADEGGIEAFVRMVAERRPSYGGPTLPFPEPGERPEAGQFVACSGVLPVCVHAAAKSAGARRVHAALHALETGYGWLAREGWPLPYPDAGHGGDNAFDLYLVRGAPRAAEGLPDQPVAWSPLDAATSFAVVDAGVPDAALERCTLFALTEAGLFGEGPAESALVRRATAGFATWLAGYGYGCETDAVDLTRAPELGAIGASDEQATALAVLFASVSRRHDAESGALLRGLWEAAQKHSAQPSKLHLAPDVLDALSAALERAGESLDRAATELGFTRYLEPATLGLGAAPKVADVFAMDKLPARTRACEPALATYGSAYARVDTRDVQPGMRLGVWLRGEPNVRWSLGAVRLDAAGHELGRLDAPPRPLAQSFLPVELTSDTAQVLVVVTELPWKKPDARDSGEERRCFQLTFDRLEH